jgi:cyclase
VPTIPFVRGLYEVADQVYAYLQPDGSWGYSNAGLVAGDGESILVDTLFDLHLTAAMLEAMRAVTESAPISTVVNTHANGDHCFGNELVEGARVVSSAATAAEMADLPAAALHGLKELDLGAAGNRFVEQAFGAFDFEDIAMVPPTSTFHGTHTLVVGGRTVELMEVGPAHTAGDVIVHVPDAATVFTGDILFVGSTLVVGDGVGVAQGEADVVPAVEQALPGELVEREGGREPGRRRLNGAAGHVDGDLERRGRPPPRPAGRGRTRA